MLSLWTVTRAAFDATSKLLHAQLRGVGDAGDTTSSEPVDDAAVLSQLGIAVRPMIASTLRALGYQDGDDVLVLKLWDKARTPTDLDTGETRVYAAGAITTALRLLAGRIDVNAARINLGGGATARVAREGDTVRVTIPIGTTFTATVGGTPTTFTTAEAVVCNGTITSGSTRVRAED